MKYSLPDKVTTFKFRPVQGWKKKKIDYILHSQNFEVQSAFSISDEVLKIDYGCPNEICPSDHLFIQGTLSLK